MPIPDYQTLMLPVLRKAARREVKVSQAVEEIADEFGLSDDEKACDPRPQIAQAPDPV